MRLCHITGSHTQHNNFTSTNSHSTTNFLGTSLSLRRAIRHQHLTLSSCSPLGPLRRFLILHSPVLGGFVFLFSFLFIIFQRKPAQKTIRPQARPRAKESVMIPTLLMNIPNPPTKQQPKRQFLFASGSGFCEFSFCFFFFLFYLFFYCGMGNGTGVAYIRMGIEVGGQALLGGGHQQIHRRRKKSGSAMP